MWGKPKKKKRSLERAIRRARRRSPPPPEKPVFRYLEAVYRIRCQYTAAEIRKALGADNWVKQLRKKPTGHGLLIGATAGTHIKKGYRWKFVNTLEFARKKKVSPENLRQFIRENGGINGCVLKHRQLLTQKLVPTLVRSTGEPD